MVMATVFSCQRRPLEVRKELLDIHRIKRANYRGNRSLIPTTAGHSSSPLPPLARVIALRCGIGPWLPWLPWLTSESLCLAFGAMHHALVTTARRVGAHVNESLCRMRHHVVRRLLLDAFDDGLALRFIGPASRLFVLRFHQAGA
jgi:hypothetical protein